MAKFLSMLIFLTGCNGVFYQPDSHVYGDPKSLEYKTMQKMINSSNNSLLDVISFESVGNSKGTVIQFHGNAQNLTAHLYSSYWLPDFGYNLVVFDYQGYGKSSGNPSRASTIEDGLSVLKYTQEIFSKQPIFILGQSLGGAIGYVSAALTTVPICGVVIESSFGSYRSITRTKLGQYWISSWLKWPLSYLVSNELSPVDFSDKIKIPAIFFHSKFDVIVPSSEGELFFKSHQGEKEWISIIDKQHIGAFVAEDDKYRKLMLNFFDNQIKLCNKK